MLNRRILILVLACIGGTTLRRGLAQVTIPDPGTHVVDNAGIIDPAVQSQLEGWLVDLKQKATAEVKILTVRSTEGEDEFGFGLRHAQAWKLGRKGKDNGALIVICLEQKDIRIHTGYGVEGALPDVWCKSALDTLAVPEFKRGNYSDGVLKVAVAVANRIADDAGVKLSGIPNYRYEGRSKRRSMICGGGLLPLIVMISIFSSMSRRGRHRHTWGGGLWQGLFLGSIMSGMMGGGRGHWGGGFGGGSFGGGFGGGSFGGGGGFGGGGAGASW